MDHDDRNDKTHHAYFTTKTLSTLLFEVWRLGTIPGLVAVLLASMFMAVLYEGMKCYIINVVMSIPREVSNKTVCHVLSHLWKTIVHVLHFIVGYAIMLCVMTYNIWILVTVTLGSGIGYYFFSILATHTKRHSPPQNDSICTHKEEKVVYRNFLEHKVLVKTNGEHETLIKPNCKRGMVKANGEHEALVKPNGEREILVKPNGEYEVLVKTNGERDVLVKANGENELLIKENGETAVIIKESML